MRILFIHEVNYLTKPIYEMHEFPEHLASLGHEIAFWHFPENFTKSQIRELGWKSAQPGRSMPKQAITLYTPQGATGSFFGRLQTALLATKLGKRIIQDFRPDVVVSFSVPTSGWQALRVARRMKIPYVFRALDVSHKIRKSPLAPLILLVERFIYANADLISANNPAMLDYAERVAGKLRQGSVHYPPLELEMFRKGNRQRGEQGWGLKDGDPMALYLGSFFYFSGLPRVLEAMKAQKTEFKLVLVGGGEQQDLLSGLVQSLDLESQVVFTGFVGFRELPDLIAAADVAINPMERSLVSDSALPNKVLQYLASGVPVISTKLSGLYAVFGDETGITWVDSPELLVAATAEQLRQGSAPDTSAAQQHLVQMERSAIRSFEGALESLRGRT